jgi:hypothetical protein
MLQEPAIIIDAATSSIRLRQFDRRYRPLASVTPDRNSQTMGVVEPDRIDGARLSVSQDDGFAYKLFLRLIEFGKDRGCSCFTG